MQVRRVLALGAALFAVLARPSAAQSGYDTGGLETGHIAVRHVTFIDTTGEEIGTVTLMQTGRGLLVQADLSMLPPGEHAFHFHEVGACEWPSFESAGGHFAGKRSAHGFLARHGPHAGDLPNVYVPGNGVLKVEEYNPNVSFTSGTAPLLDRDGSALVIHAQPDDYHSQPSGDAGNRIACAVISQDNSEE
jgi:superoxide dismutase, Cu-Zn family